MPDLRSLTDLDTDIRELRTKQLQARAAGEDDYALVLTCALNRALEERHAASHRPGQAVATQGASPAAAGH